MFGKLLKYELKSVGKWYFGLYGVAGLLSLIIGFGATILNKQASQYYDSSGVGIAILLLIIISFAIVIGGLILSTFLLIINRFRKNVYGRQGYLTMTLPVTNHQIILSKLTASLIWCLLSGITIIVCFFTIMLIVDPPVSAAHMAEMIRSMKDGYQNITEVSFTLYYILNFIINSIHAILTIYFAISLGQLFKDHRTLLAIVFYFALNLGETFLTLLLFLPLGAPTPMTSATYLPLTLTLSTLLSLTYYFGTYYIMTKKLNLQ